MHPTHEKLQLKIAVLTVSDTRTALTDQGGQLIQKLAQQQGFSIVDYKIVQDEPAQLSEQVLAWCHNPHIDAIISTGGTGFTPRDVTYDTIAQLFEKEMTGFGELFRLLSYEDIGARAMFSRATAGCLLQTAIYLLPGSTNAVKLGMEKLILPTIQHFVGELHRQ